MNDSAHAKIPVLESAISEVLLPQPHRDAGQRSLVRDEIRTRFAGKQGTDLTTTLIAHLGTNPLQDAEIIGEFGKSMMAGAPDQHASVRASAIGEVQQARRRVGASACCIEGVRGDEAGQPSRGCCRSPRGGEDADGKPMKESSRQKRLGEAASRALSTCQELQRNCDRPGR